MIKKIVLILFLSTLAYHGYAQSIDLAGAIVDDVSDEVQQKEASYETQRADENVADDRGIFSFLNFSFIKKPLSIFSSSDKIEEKGDNQAINQDSDSSAPKKETQLERATRLAENGDENMALTLGYMYLYGQDGVEADYQKAFHFYELAAQKNNIIALNNLGSLYFSGIGTDVDYQKAADLFLKAAQNGSDDAAVNLGFIYLSSGKSQYFKPAIDLFEQAAGADNNTANFMLGYAYHKGFVVQQDQRKAVELIKKAAKAQFDEGQLVLADMYAKGEGIAKNYGNAVGLYRAAGAQGNVEAMMHLADILTEGRMFPQNLMQAHISYNVASVYGSQEAAQKRDALEGALKIEDLLEAQSAAEKYKEKPSELTIYIRQTFGKNIRRYIDGNLQKQRGTHAD